MVARYAGYRRNDGLGTRHTQVFSCMSVVRANNGVRLRYWTCDEWHHQPALVASNSNRGRRRCICSYLHGYLRAMTKRSPHPHHHHRLRRRSSPPRRHPRPRLHPRPASASLRIQWRRGVPCWCERGGAWWWGKERAMGADREGARHQPLKCNPVARPDHIPRITIPRAVHVRLREQRDDCAAR